MRVTIETSNIQEFNALMQVLNSLKIEKVVVGNLADGITKGDKSIHAKALFGIWKSSPKNLETLRAKSWNRNWE